MLVEMHILKHYPKLLLFACSCVASYILVQNGTFESVTHLLNTGGYLSAFFAGLLFSFGFATPFAIGLFIAIAPDVHPLQAALLGGAGALLSDLLLFSFARLSLKDELHRLSLTHLWQRCIGMLHRDHFHPSVRKAVLVLTAGLIIASPLPDEIGVTMLGGATRMNGRAFGVLSYALNTLGILVILLLAQ